MISFITQPVAIGAYAAASVAKSDPLKTGFEAMRPGSIIYFVPFFFVLNSALIGVGKVAEVVVAFGAAILGIVLIAAGLQGHLYWVGSMKNSIVGWISRVLLALGGIVMALPGNSEIVGYSHLQLNLAAVVLAVTGAAACWFAANP